MFWFSADDASAQSAAPYFLRERGQGRNSWITYPMLWGAKIPLPGIGAIARLQRFPDNARELQAAAFAA